MDNTLENKISQIKEWLGSGSINIFGLPFSGKDTHGQELSKSFDAELLSGGDILRSSAGPEHIKKHIAQGHLAPQDEYLAIITPFLSQDSLNGRPLILSSVGRWQGEEKSIIKAAKESGHPIKAVVYLSVTKEEAYRRWKLAERGREDDMSEEVLDNRFNIFIEKTTPVIKAYRDLGLVIEVDGMPPKETVTMDILDKLLEFSKQSKAVKV